MVYLVKWKEKILLTAKDKTTVLNDAIAQGIMVSADLSTVTTVSGVVYAGYSFSLTIDRPIILGGFVIFDESLKYLIWDHKK